MGKAFKLEVEHTQECVLLHKKFGYCLHDYYTGERVNFLHPPTGVKLKKYEVQHDLSCCSFHERICGWCFHDKHTLEPVDVLGDYPSPSVSTIDVNNKFLTYS